MIFFLHTIEYPKTENHIRMALLSKMCYTIFIYVQTLPHSTVCAVLSEEFLDFKIYVRFYNYEYSRYD